MAVVKELLRIEENGTLSFGDYTLPQKSKLDNVEFRGDLYKVKTCCEITKLERNGMFVYESVPGTSVEHLLITDQEFSFHVFAVGNVQFTVGLEPESEYQVSINGEDAGIVTTNLSGKLSISAELSEEKSAAIQIVKC